VNVDPDIKGNKKISSMSYKRKKTHINKNCSDNWIGLCVCGLKPH